MYSNKLLSGRCYWVYDVYKVYIDNEWKDWLGTTPSSVDIQITQRVQATGSSFLPDYDQALNISTNVQLETGNQKFIIEEPIDFKFSSSLDPTGVEIYSLSGDDPSEYLLTKTVTATSGEIVTKTVNVGGLTKFFTFDINDTNIIKKALEK